MFDRKFFGREPVQKPTCPFCSSLLEKPKELTTRRPGELPVGTCTCGAVYACDETGHNLGAAQIEALVFSCDMDWDLAWGLEEGEDFMIEIVENYDFKNHLIVSAGVYEGRRTGALFFVRLHQEVQEVTSEGVQQSMARAVSTPPETSSGSSDTKPLSKKMVEKYVTEYQVDPILSSAQDHKKIIRYLQRLLYSGDDLFREKAAEILGKACAVVAQKDPGFISKLLQGLFYSISDTAAFPMGAFEAIGGIISQRPDLFGGYAAQLYQFTADKTRNAQALLALGRIAKLSPEILSKHTLHFFIFLDDPDPTVRGMTALLLGNLKAHDAKKILEKLVQESHEIEIYENGEFETKTVGRLAREALLEIP